MDFQQSTLVIGNHSLHLTLREKVNRKNNCSIAYKPDNKMREQQQQENDRLFYFIFTMDY